MTIDSIEFGFSARAVIRGADQAVLLLRRTAMEERWSGTWELPGGKVNQGESVISALHREVEEETGLSIQPLKFLGAVNFFISDRNVQVIELVFACLALSAEAVVSDEHDALQWASAEKASRLPMRPGHRHMIEQNIVQKEALDHCVCYLPAEGGRLELRW